MLRIIVLWSIALTLLDASALLPVESFIVGEKRRRRFATITTPTLPALVGIQNRWSLRQRQFLSHDPATPVLSVASATLSSSDFPSSSLPDTNIQITVPSFSTVRDEGDHSDDHNDEEYPSPLHKLHVRSILTDEQAQTILNRATQYAKETGRWNFPDALRHSSYPTCDFPVLENDECPTIQSYLEEIDFDKKMFGLMSELYGIDVDDLSYLDLFIAHYQAKDTSHEVEKQENNKESSTGGDDDDDDDDDNSTNIIDRLELHRDGSLLSFSLLLNDPDQFEGGGTYYDALRIDADTNSIIYDDDISSVLFDGGVIRPKRAGDAVLHCGKILHGADTVTSGNRTVLVGFVDVNERCIRPGALAAACKQFGRMDVAKYRGDVQDRHHNRGWILTKNNKWLRGSPSTIKNMYVPALSGVVRRSDPDFHRIQRLTAEDQLLRTILLPKEERTDIEPWYGEDISIVD